MRNGAYERLTTSAPGTAFKRFVQQRAPGTATRFQRAIRAARRSWLEPAVPNLLTEQLLWHPPPRRPRHYPAVAGEVTNKLFARLTEDDLALMRSRLTAEDASVWEQTDESARRLLALHFCVHYEVPGVLERTGLIGTAPPTSIGAHAHGSLAAGGSFYYADLVADSLADVGVDISTRQRALDFGCSDGRVTRVLATTYPEVDWHACDPDEAAIQWAAANLPGAHYFEVSTRPPLPVPDDHFDYVFAIGIWTQYSERAALEWLEEMRRIVDVGGHLLLTAHGYRAVEMHQGEWGEWPAELIAQTATRLYADGHAFVGGYGKQLSLQLATPDWGEAFFTPEWLCDHACPSWAVVDFKPGYVENNHDLYLLQRRV